MYFSKIKHTKLCLTHRRCQGIFELIRTLGGNRRIAKLLSRFLFYPSIHNKIKNRYYENVSSSNAKLKNILGILYKFFLFSPFSSQDYLPNSRYRIYRYRRSGWFFRIDQYLLTRLFELNWYQRIRIHRWSLPISRFLTNYRIFLPIPR